MSCRASASVSWGSPPGSEFHSTLDHLMGRSSQDNFPAPFDLTTFAPDIEALDALVSRQRSDPLSPFNAFRRRSVVRSAELTESIRVASPDLHPTALGNAGPMGTISEPVFDNGIDQDSLALGQTTSASPFSDNKASIGLTSEDAMALAAADGIPGRSADDGSDNESESSEGGLHGANTLDDPMSDDFGLLERGPNDGTDLGGKAKDGSGEHPPAWSELKTKAGKERKRLPLACIACRRKKIRCSGEKPACKHCLRSRVPCVYKVTARKAAPRTDYMAMLDKRLKRMEERIIKIVPKSEHDAATPPVARAVVKPAIPGSIGGSKAASKKRGADEAFGPDLEHWARGLSKSQPGGDATKPGSLKAQEAEEGKLFLEGKDALPSKEIQEHLAEVFFETIYGQAYHVLHKPSYMRKLRAGTLPPVLVLSVCAVSARFSTHPKLATSPNFLRGEEWASHARDIVTRRYEWPNITILTCLLLLGLHEFGTCHGGRSWAFGGQAIRMAFALQLHKDLEFDPMVRGEKEAQLSFVDREIRRRTMWACFLMDRFNSSGTDRPTFVREETIKTPLPVKEKFFQLDMPAATEMLSGPSLEPLAGKDGELVDAGENMGVAAYMIRAIAIWGRVINYLNQGGKEADPHPMWSPESGYAALMKQTEEIAENLPDSLTYSMDNLHQHDTENQANQFVFLHIAIQQNILFMNRFAVTSPNGSVHKDVPKPFVTKAGAKAFAAANRISELLKDSESYLISAPFVGYCAFLSSTVHIFGIFSGNPAIESTSKRNLTSNVKFLAKMKRYWGMFHWMSENLREQFRSCADSARQGTPANEAAASPIFQYGDWFDRYPHGVSQTDFGDPASHKSKEKGGDAVLEQKPELHTVEEFITTLSPQSSNTANLANGKQSSSKRKSVSKKSTAMVSRNGQQHLDRLQTDVAGNLIGAEQSGRTVPTLQRRQSSNMSSGGFASPMALSQSSAAAAAATAAAYQNMSPISPGGLTGYGNPHGHSLPHTPASYYPAPDPFGVHLASYSNTMGLPQLDRQLVFNAYGGVDTTSQRMASLAGWPVDGAQNAARAEARRTALANAQNPHGPTSTPDPLSAGLGAEASSAWFMPFNMEPPEIGPDLSLGTPGGLDGFGSMFASGSMTAPNGAMGNGMHQGGAGRNQ